MSTARLPWSNRQWRGEVEERHILVIGTAPSYTRYGNRDLWLLEVPRVFDGACSYWLFYRDPEMERPIRFTCNGDP